MCQQPTSKTFPAIPKYVDEKNDSAYYNITNTVEQTHLHQQKEYRIN
jgi:hypothetical protein